MLQDGVLGLDDLQEGDALQPYPATDRKPAGGPQSLVGRPLVEVERFFIEQALELTQGRREEAAKILGIGERTLYRSMVDWKLQDKVKEALAAAKGDTAGAAKTLGMKESELVRKLRKWGMAVK